MCFLIYFLLFSQRTALFFWFHGTLVLPHTRRLLGFCVRAFGCGLAAALCSVMAFFYSFINFFSFYRRNPIGSFFCENLIR
jgi:hypothetical protein